MKIKPLFCLIVLEYFYLTTNFANVIVISYLACRYHTRLYTYTHAHVCIKISECVSAYWEITCVCKNILIFEHNSDYNIRKRIEHDNVQNISTGATFIHSL